MPINLLVAYLQHWFTHGDTTGGAAKSLATLDVGVNHATPKHAVPVNDPPLPPSQGECV